MRQFTAVAVRNNNAPGRLSSIPLAAALLALVALVPVSAAATPRHFDIATQALSTALGEFARQSDRQILFSTTVVDARRTEGIKGELEPEAALSQLLRGSGLGYRVTADDTILVLARAQDESGESGSEQTVPLSREGEGNVELAEVLVTAQKREESAQKAAIAISVVEPEALLSVTAPEQLTKLVPAVQISATGTSPLIYVRGVGTLSGNPYTDAAVAVNYDGIYLGRPSSISGLYYDMERIEVLKGPQGTLYGRNSTGGAMNILPARPVLGSNSMDATLSAGNFDAVNAQAALNLALSDAVALRLASSAYSHSGYMSDGTYSERGRGGRIQLLVDPGTSWNLRLSSDYFHLGGTGPSGTILGAITPTGSLVAAPYGRDVGLHDPRTDAFLSSSAAFVDVSGAVFGPNATRPGLDNNYYGVHAEFKADLGVGDLVVLPAWRRADRDETFNPSAFALTSDETDEQYSIEARLSGTAGSIDWLGGAFYFDESVKSTFVVDNRIQGGVQYIDSQNDSWAGFGRLTWNLTDRMRLTGAGRYTDDRKDFDGRAETLQAVCFQRTVLGNPNAVCPDIRRLPANFTSVAQAMADIGYVLSTDPSGRPVYVDPTNPLYVLYQLTVTPVNQSLSTSKFTWRAGVEFDVGPSSLLYASVETGYRSGGFSFSSLKPTVNPESITAYTVGSKNRFWDNRVQLNVEGFFWKYKDQQNTHFGRGANGEVELVTENIGESTNKGIEVELLVKPLPNTLLRADVQYLDAEYDRFIYSDLDNSPTGQPGTIAPVTGCPTQFDSTAGNWIVDCSGFPAQFSPEWTMNFGVQQTIPIPNNLKLVADAGTHYQSSTVQLFEQLSAFAPGSYWMSDASLALASQDDRWSLTAYVENIEDKRVATSMLYNGLPSTVGASLSPPRTYGLRLRASF